MDGSSLGNSGSAGIGLSFQNCRGDFKMVVAMGIGEAKIFWAECLPIVVAVEVAVEKQ